jgi:hypothetical protein
VNVVFVNDDDTVDAILTLAENSLVLPAEALTEAAPTTLADISLITVGVLVTVTAVETADATVLILVDVVDCVTATDAFAVDDNILERVEATETDVAALPVPRKTSNDVMLSRVPKFHVSSAPH